MTYKIQIKIKISVGYLSDLISEFTLVDHEYTYSRSILTITRFTNQREALHFASSFEFIHLQSVSIVLETSK